MANMQDLDMSDAPEMRDGFELFPPGEYVMYLEESERKPTNANDGEYLNCTFVVAEGEYQSRKVFHIFNLWNKSPKSVLGAKADWRGLCEAAIGQPSAPNGDSTGLHFKKFIGTVGVEAENTAKDGKTYPAKNKMIFKKGSLKSLAQQGSVPVGVSTPATQQQQPAVANAPVVATQSPQVAQAAAAAGAARPAWAKR